MCMRKVVKLRGIWDMFELSMSNWEDQDLVWVSIVSKVIVLRYHQLGQKTAKCDSMRFMCVERELWWIGNSEKLWK